MEAWVQQQLGSAVVRRRSVAGGCSHSAWQLHLADGRQVFAKTNHASALPLLAAEAEGLKALAPWAQPPLQLPQPLALGVSAGQAVLLLSWLELLPSGGSPGEWRRLGGALAALHRASSTEARSFGFPSDNYIGGTLQPNGWLDHWGRFFVERRLAPQLALAAQRGLALAQGQALLDRAAELLDGHGCGAALVHGDLWSGNAGLLVDGGVALFDPAVYWGDREVDLAMARLLGGFPESFFAGYQVEWPLPPTSCHRTPLYNLYHLLNHANLFGGSYRNQVEAQVASLLT